MGQGKAACVAVTAALGLLLAGGCSTARVDELARSTATTTPARATTDDAVERATHDDVLLHDAFTRSSFEEHALGFVSGGWKKALHGEFDSLSVIAPKTSDAPFKVSIGQIQRWNVGVHLAGVSGGGADRASGRLTYRDAQPDADLLALSTDTRFELALVVRSPNASRRSEWPIELASGLHSEVRSDDTGRLTSIEFEDATGRTRLRMPRPYAVDADGKRIDLEVDWQDGRLALTLPPGDLAYPVVVDPAMEQSLWEKIATTGNPGANDFHGFSYDSTRKVIVMFGGDLNNTPVNDVWELSGTTWTKKTWTGAGPVGRINPCLMYDGTRTVMYGGAASGSPGTTLYSDAWAWSGSAWTQPFTNVPTEYVGSNGLIDCAWDAQRNVGVLYGELGTSQNGATSQLSGNAWSALIPGIADGPGISPTTGFNSFGLTYDARDKFVIAYSLNSYPRQGFVWNANAWSSYVSSMFGGNAVFYDPRRSAVVSVYFNYPNNATALTYEDGTDAHRAPTSMTTGLGNVDRVVFDVAGNRAVMYNGATWIYEHRGGSCTQDSQCDTGHCVDGVCCEQATCTGTCMSCSSGAVPGTCSAVENAQDADTCTGAKSCDKNGACRAANGEACVAGSDCFSGLCLANVCVGNTCTASTDCTSGFCVDGVCCNTACNATCQACKGSLREGGGVDGVCGNAKATFDPHNTCAVDAANPCANSGQCDSAGACAPTDKGTSCGPDACDTTNDVTLQQCDGIGMCHTVASTMCAPYLCTSGVCTTTCTDASECDRNTGACIDGHCVVHESAGDKCATNTDCASGYCTDGVCCDRACSGQCEACDVAQSAGSCVPVVGKPHGSRASCDAASATNACSSRVCDGLTQTSCEGYAAADVECHVAGCAADIQSLASHCDGKGTCPDAVTKTCAPFACGGTGCLTACASDADCVGGATCDLTKKTCNTAAVCHDDHTIVNPNGTVADCTPYHCGAGACLTSCKNVDDCVVPSVCDATLHCVPPTASSPASEDGGGCSLSPRARGEKLPLLLLALLVLARRRRR